MQQQIRENTQLENHIVHLRPVSSTDLDEYRSIAFDPEIWRFYAGRVSSEEELAGFMESAIRDIETGKRLVFSIIDKCVSRCIGSTAFGNISYPDFRVEIGWTWLSTQFRGRGINHSCKYLLMQYAFENLGFERVEFKTDVLNAAARRALIKEGAVEEGLLRSHTVMPGGRRRDTIYYSVLRSEWPQLKTTVFSDLAGQNVGSR